MPTNPEKYLTYYYSKKDVMDIWRVRDHRQFETMLGDEGKKILEWKEGRQRFIPARVRELIQYLGTPITKEDFSR